MNERGEMQQLDFSVSVGVDVENSDGWLAGWLTSYLLLC